MQETNLIKTSSKTVIQEVLTNGGASLLYVQKVIYDKTEVCF